MAEMQHHKTKATEATAPTKATPPTPILLLSVALAAEGRPLIDTLGLSRTTLGGLTAYANANTLLVQTGVGKLRAAATIATALALRPGIKACLNTGICGAAAAVGTPLLAAQITDAGSGQQWFPGLQFSHFDRTARQLESCHLFTVDAPDTRYREGIAYDMEAAGVLTATSPHIPLELIQCLKVVSDSSPEQLAELTQMQNRKQSSKYISELMSTSMPHIIAVSDALRRLAGDLPEQSAVQTFTAAACERWRSSVTQQHQLQQAVQRYHALTGTLPELAAHQQRQQLMQTLEAPLQAMQIEYSADSNVDGHTREQHHPDA